MTLSDLAALGSFVSGVAVLISLVFLYFQLRQVNAQVLQNSKHTQALIWQGASNRGAAQMVAMADADLCAAYLAGNGKAVTPEAIKQRQFQLQAFAWYQISFAEMFQQMHDGLLEPEKWTLIGAHLKQQMADDPGAADLMRGLMALDEAKNDPYYKFLRTIMPEQQKTDAPGTKP